jgi:hypothetical protein
MKASRLLTRDEFREQVFARDNNLCVICRAPAVDAHHILERKLWMDGGYYIANGASLCSDCHIKAEETTLSVEKIMEAAGIIERVLPEHLYRDQVYSKWGDPILPNGRRLRGELFNDPSVQKILKQGGVLDLYTKYVKYPRTWHADFSPGVSKDDRVLVDYTAFDGQEIVVTVKQDGENTSLYDDYLHARSLDYEPHPSRDLLKAFHASIAHDIPSGWRLCVENIYAKHSIHYKHLKSLFQLFSVWNDKNECLSWDETAEWAQLLSLDTVPIIYRGPFNLKHLKSLYTPIWNNDECEGFVVRLASKFHYKDFKTNVFKYVRENHVQHNSSHWRRGIISKNEIDKSV